MPYADLNIWNDTKFLNVVPAATLGSSRVPRAPLRQTVTLEVDTVIREDKTYHRLDNRIVVNTFDSGTSPVVDSDSVHIVAFKKDREVSRRWMIARRIDRIAAVDQAIEGLSEEFNNSKVWTTAAPNVR